MIERCLASGRRVWAALAGQSCFVLVVLIAWLHLFTHGTNIDHNELPLDDAGTWGVAMHSLGTVFTLPTEFHSQPPLYYLILHFIAGVNSAPWVLRGFSWLCCLGFILFVLLYLHELNRFARIALCLVFIEADLTKYLATAVRPYGLAAFFTLGSVVFFLRMLRQPTRRRAVAYAVWTMLMAYTMAFEVAVLLVQGVFFALVCSLELPWKGPKQLWQQRSMLFFAMLTVAIGYLPYLAMAIHYQYRPNPVDTTPAVLNFLTYQNTFNEHLGFAPMMFTGLVMLSILGLFEKLRQGRFESLFLPLLCAGQVAFVWYFIVGRSSIGPLGKYMMPAFVAACLLIGFGVNAAVRNTSKTTGLVFFAAMLVYLCPQYNAFAAYMHAPKPVGEFRRLHQTMRTQPGSRIIFFDIGYDGQHLEYVIRKDPTTTTATMRGSGWAAGGDSHLDPDYILRTIAETKARTRCYYYYLQDPAGVFATTFVPAMAKEGYVRIADMHPIHGRPVPGYCRP